MSESKHTPGPWKLCFHLQSAENDASCPCGYRGGIWGNDGDHMVCEMGSTSTPGEEGLAPARYPRAIELANARLISAAPDLLEALNLLVADVQDYPAWQRPCLAVDVARAAIAKATEPAP